ncbi:MAG: ComF family protein [Candidatus Azambacteria bacterium]|nr:ComF family protein [Candidatus Azambacteria bacterium]
MNLKNLLLDLVFPRHCLGCRIELTSKQASLICEACFDKIILNSALKCHICGLRIGQMEIHKNCRKKTNIKIIFSAGHYSDPILKETIHAFKYHSIESLKETLAGLMIKYIKKERLEKKFAGSILVPIPLTLRRRLIRGFNQSELLANELSKFLNCPVVNMLTRKKFTTPQADISDWKKRKENVSGAFILSPPYTQNYRFLESIVILVDDVSTSGATLEEAARVLKEAGVKEIYGLVVARG